MQVERFEAAVSQSAVPSPPPRDAGSWLWQGGAGSRRAERQAGVELKEMSLELKEISSELKDISLELQEVSLELKEIFLELKGAQKAGRQG